MASSRYSSEQRRLGTERDSATASSANFPEDLKASSGFSEYKGLGGWDAQSRGLIKPGLGHSYYRVYPPSLTGDMHPKSPRTTGNEAGDYNLTEFE